MENLIKYIWFSFVIIGSICMVVNLPYDAWRQAYLYEVHQIQLVPLKKIDATNRYIEAIESGQEDISKGIQPTPPKKYYRDIPYQSVKRIGKLYIYEGPDAYNNATKYSDAQQERQERKYQKPLYRRDENNPNVLHKVY